MRNIVIAVVGIAVLSLVSAAGAETRPIKVLLIAGGCCHDYEHQKDILAKGIAQRANVEITIAYDPVKNTSHLNPIYANPDWAKGFDVIIHDECTADFKDLKVINDVILKPHRDGLPGVILHCGMHCYRSEGWPKTVTPWFEFTGLQTTGHGKQAPIEVAYTDKSSPITKGLEDWKTINEELYNNIVGRLLDTAKELSKGKQTVTDKGGKSTTTETIVTWTNVYNGKTKVFGTTLGHNNDTCADPKYLDLVSRGLLWATGHLTEDGKPEAGYEGKK